MARRRTRYGWLPDIPDQRDHLYAAPPAVLRALPVSVDLRAQCPPVLNQGDLGSCTANAIASAHRFDQMKQGSVSFQPSRLFIYYNERVIEGNVDSDSGAMLRDGVKSIARQGVCPERDWPYVASKFATKPPARAYTEAKRHQAIEYQRVMQTLSQMRGCLADGYPFIFGFTVYESFESEAVARTGKVPMPGPGEGTMGGHAMMAVGYRDGSQQFLVMNSWSTGWGDQGFCTMPYAYLLDTSLTADLWTIRVVET